MRPGIHTYCASPQEVRVGWCQWLHLCSDSDHQIRAENLIADLAAEERSSNSLPRKSALRSTTDKSLPKKRVTFRDAVTIKHVSKPGQFSHVQNGSRVTKGPDRIFYQEVAQGSTGGQSDQDWSGVDGGGRVPNQSLLGLCVDNAVAHTVHSAAREEWSVSGSATRNASRHRKRLVGGLPVVVRQRLLRDGAIDTEGPCARDFRLVAGCERGGMAGAQP
ncbi:uncharacterized protein MCYG_07395 [Microsporum canis CBS 113480]|uniref:Uncharacterized protein n=1 Tax=Arthroderma otae (strain ATCC MYA-4605 / CBS 113480) TaxID=554155 RepID=C5FYH8_ARTOC|nr:uncharacterized protein MCYG_07395 [Microsporum canis CBS 113480]EEQ34576.1 predicted protein [Microsporum canis CBS 113480]